VSRLLSDLRGRCEITLVCGVRPGELRELEAVRGMVAELVSVERPFVGEMGAVARMAERWHTATGVIQTGWPVSVVKLRRRGVAQALRETLSRKDFDVFHAELGPMAAYAEALPTALPKVLVDHEVEPEGAVASARYRRFREETYRRFDRVVTLCDEEATRLRELLPGLSVSVRPVAWKVGTEPRGSAHPGRVLFVGSPHHAPNRDALQWIARELLPALRRAAPSVVLECAGERIPGDPLTAELERAGAVVLGHVPDLERHLVESVCLLAPIRTGGGVRIKVLEALGHAVPVVTTRLGARGLSQLPIPAHWIGDTTESLVQGVCRILRDPAEARREAARVRSAMADEFAPSRETERTLEVWREVRRE
jgi:hypothetical protein